MRGYNNCTKGALSPIPATEDMTQEVGARGLRLFTKPTTAYPEQMYTYRVSFTDTLGTYYLNVVSNAPFTTYTELQRAVKTGKAHISNGWVQSTLTITHLIAGVTSIGESGMGGEPYLGFYLVKLSDFSVANPIIDVVTDFSTSKMS